MGDTVVNTVIYLLVCFLKLQLLWSYSIDKIYTKAYAAVNTFIGYRV